MQDRAGVALLGDVGGTNARFAIWRAGGGGAEQMATLAVAEHRGIVPALRTFLDGIPDELRRALRWGILAVAGPVDDRRAVLTNGRWRIDAGTIESRLGLERVVLLNDFAAQAFALPQLRTRDIVKVGGGRPARACPRAVLGPGTGLGVAALIPAVPDAIVVTGEGGHATMASANDREAAILAALRRRFGHVSAERVLSGEGLVNLYRLIASEAGRKHRRPPTPEEITDRAVAGSCPESRAALDMFCAMLGTVAGNLALTYGARGGVYVAGGIVPRFTEFFARSAFRERFEAKGRFHGYVAAIPTYVVVHPTPGFAGLAALARGLAANAALIQAHPRRASLS